MTIEPTPFRLIPRPTIYPLTAEREAELRRQVVAEALSWVGTPYRQLGATRGIAVDCSMLIVRTLIEVGVVEDFDPRPYPPLWFLHREDERYIGWLEKTTNEVREPQPADIVAIRIGRAFAHSGFYVGGGQIVHAFAEEGRCTVTPLRNPLLLYADRVGKILRPRRFFDLFAGLRALEPAA
jgi:cell wall-associated NlpC family hydrolase